MLMQGMLNICVRERNILLETFTIALSVVVLHLNMERYTCDLPECDTLVSEAKEDIFCTKTGFTNTDIMC